MPLLQSHGLDTRRRFVSDSQLVVLGWRHETILIVWSRCSCILEVLLEALGTERGELDFLLEALTHLAQMLL